MIARRGGHQCTRPAALMDQSKQTTNQQSHGIGCSTIGKKLVSYRIWRYHCEYNDDWPAMDPNSK